MMRLQHDTEMRLSCLYLLKVWLCSLEQSRKDAYKHWQMTNLTWDKPALTISVNLRYQSSCEVALLDYQSALTWSS